MATAENKKVKKIVAEDVRFSYLNVFEPKAFEEGQTPKYHATLLIPKSTKKGKALIKKIEDAIEQLKNDNKQTVYNGSFGTKFWNPLRDGDEEKEGVDGYEDHMFIAVKSDRKPAVFDDKGNKILDPAEFYSGCIGHCSFNLYAYGKVGKGVSAGLLACVKTDDGEAFGAGSNFAEDFKGLVDFDGSGEEDETPAPKKAAAKKKADDVDWV